MALAAITGPIAASSDMGFDSGCPSATPPLCALIKHDGSRRCRNSAALPHIKVIAMKALQCSPNGISRSCGCRYKMTGAPHAGERTEDAPVECQTPRLSSPVTTRVRVT